MGESVRVVQPLEEEVPVRGLKGDGEEEHVVRVMEVGSSQYPRRKFEGSL